jgi:hypothetical protein
MFTDTLYIYLILYLQRQRFFRMFILYLYSLLPEYQLELSTALKCHFEQEMLQFTPVQSLRSLKTKGRLNTRLYFRERKRTSMMRS